LSERRIVITGLGAVSSVGHNVADMWSSLVAGRSGIGPITKFDASNFRARIAGEVLNLELSPWITPRDARRLDPFCHYAIVASEEALADSALLDAELDRKRVGVLVGSGIGGLVTTEVQYKRMLELGPNKVSPFLIPMMIGDMASGCISIRHKFQGPNFGIVSACATGAHAIGEAYWALKRGDADVMVAGGTEACVTELSCAGFCAIKALSTRNDEPTKASRPFDATRDGFVLAEGAGVMVLETLEHALARNAPIKAELVGYAASGDGHHITAPPEDGNGATQAILAALAHANVSPEEVGYINAHGTSTPMNDRVETAAIKAAFGDAAYDVPISSTKSLTGHTLGAAGGIETVICAKSIVENTIPGTWNYSTPDPNCDLFVVPNQTLEREVNVAINMNFGFGGHNAVVVLKALDS
jgi:3-oxoacyl-[acyl-carrier-protein] synthase II